jgi:hypothetical protein
MNEAAIEKSFLIRDQSGLRLIEVQGFPATISSLPGWKFFIRHQLDVWILTEVRSDAKFPTSRAIRIEDALKEFEEFCKKRGSEECERVFRKVIDKFGDLGRPQ